jgi:hypothetical protein
MGNAVNLKKDLKKKTIVGVDITVTVISGGDKALEESIQ